jgi:hypothetical protein
MRANPFKLETTSMPNEAIADITIVRARHLDVYTSELHRRMSELSGPSTVMVEANIRRRLRGGKEGKGET